MLIDNAGDKSRLGLCLLIINKHKKQMNDYLAWPRKRGTPLWLLQILPIYSPFQTAMTVSLSVKRNRTGLLYSIWGSKQYQHISSSTRSVDAFKSFILTIRYIDWSTNQHHQLKEAHQGSPHEYCTAV